MSLQVPMLAQDAQHWLAIHCWAPFSECFVMFAQVARSQNGARDCQGWAPFQERFGLFERHTCSQNTAHPCQGSAPFREHFVMFAEHIHPKSSPHFHCMARKLSNFKAPTSQHGLTKRPRSPRSGLKGLV